MVPNGSWRRVSKGGLVKEIKRHFNIQWRYAASCSSAACCEGSVGNAGVGRGWGAWWKFRLGDGEPMMRLSRTRRVCGGGTHLPYFAVSVHDGKFKREQDVKLVEEVRCSTPC